MSAVIEEELARGKAALASKDVLEVLRLLPGKELLPALAVMAGCKDSAAYLRAVIKHLNVDDFAPIKELAANVTKKLYG